MADAKWPDEPEAGICGDLLLIYRLSEAARKGGTIVFERAGTHRELFGE